MIQKIISGGIALFIVLNMFGLFFVPAQTAFAQDDVVQDPTGIDGYEVFLDCVVGYLIDRGLYLGGMIIYVNQQGVLVVNSPDGFTEEQLAGLIAAIHACGMHAMDIEVNGELVISEISTATETELSFKLLPAFDTLFPSVPGVNPNPLGNFRQALINFFEYGSLTAIKIFDFNGLLMDLIEFLITPVTLDEFSATASLQLTQESIIWIIIAIILVVLLIAVSIYLLLQKRK